MKKKKTKEYPASQNLHRGRDWLAAFSYCCSLDVCPHLTPSADSQWPRLLPSLCPSCRAAIASRRCSFRLWISRSLRPFIPLSSSCISVYRSQASRFSCGAKSGRRGSV